MKFTTSIPLIVLMIGLAKPSYAMDSDNNTLKSTSVDYILKNRAKFKDQIALLPEGIKEIIQSKQIKLDQQLLDATSTGNINKVKEALSQGADSNAEDKNKGNSTPLLLAAGYDDSDIVKLLLENNALIDKQNKFGITPLASAAHNNSLKSVALLLQNGAQPNIKDDEGCTALQHAIRFDARYDIIKNLLDHQAEYNTITSESSDCPQPIDLAIINKNTQVLETLLALPDIKININHLRELARRITNSKTRRAIEMLINKKALEFQRAGLAALGALSGTVASNNPPLPKEIVGVIADYAGYKPRK
ncbi:ankyrin repeat domain-containing protein [Candidatus Dependentiae bacterium]|nr:ankyrin repeat domain-containing protein [Candidatus Dependentiae bacterium]